MTDSSIVNLFRSRLIARRIALGLNQKDMAERMELGRPAISMWEGGHVNGTLQFLSRYAEQVGYRIVLEYAGTSLVTQVNGKWMFEGIEFPSRRAARDAKDASDRFAAGG